MPQFIIQGPATLSGTIKVFGSKNAALPLMAAALLTDEPITLKNIPPILDVTNMAHILQALGVTVSQAQHMVTLTATQTNTDALPREVVGLLRGSILLLGALLGRTKHVSLPRPGGDVIGARPIDAHLDGFRQLGAVVTEDAETVTIDGSAMRAGTVVLPEFSVTATENIMLAAATLPGRTTIQIAAAEPHVVALAELLQLMGATVTGAGTHQIVIEGTSSLRGAEYTNIPDMLEAGAFILLAAATSSALTVEQVPTDDLMLFFKKLDEIGIEYQLDAATHRVSVTPSRLRSFKVQTLPHPGIATDLQAPFSVIATQAHGSSLIHDPLYEGRFRHVPELQKMGASVTVCDPHRVIIQGPTPLTGRRIPSLDIRSGMTLLIAGLVAQGTTIIEQAEIIDRGYAQLTQRLRDIGANIEREE